MQQKTSFFSRISVTNLIILVNAFLYFIIITLFSFYPDSINLIAIKSSSIIAGSSIWTIFTAVFAHYSFLHLFVNMFSLFFLGNLTERIIGRKRFIWFYLAAGIIGSLFFVLFAFLGTLIGNGTLINVFGGIDDLAVGASGALFGLIGILAVLIPNKKVYLILGPLILIILQTLLSGFLAEPIATIFLFATTLAIFIMIFSMFSPNPKIRKFALPAGMPLYLAPIVAIIPLFIISFFVKLPIGNTAHLGGLLAGLIYGSYLRNKYRKKVKMLNRIIR